MRFAKGTIDRLCLGVIGHAWAVFRPSACHNSADANRFNRRETAHPQMGKLSARLAYATDMRVFATLLYDLRHLGPDFPR